MLCVNSILVFFVWFFFLGCGFFPRTSETQKTKEITSSTVLLYEEEAEEESGLEVEAGAKEDNNKSTEPVTAFSNKQKKADILFIVDTSYSMVKYLQSADKSFKNFISYLSPVSWKIALTNADYDYQLDDSYYTRDLFNGKAMRLELNGKILPYRFLYPYVLNNKKIFLDTLKRYEKGDNIEQISSNQYINPCDLPPYCQSNVRSPIGSLIKSLSANKNFLRKEAIFVSIIFTNGDDAHIKESDSADLFIRRFQEKYGKEKKILIYSISIFPGDETCFKHNKEQQYNFSQVSYSKNIHQFVRVTGGRALSICEPDYSPLAALIIKSL